MFCENGILQIEEDEAIGEGLGEEAGEEYYDEEAPEEAEWDQIKFKFDKIQ